MISNGVEYQRAQEELEYMEKWLRELMNEHPGEERGLIKASVRKMIARLQQELSMYEARTSMKHAPTESK